MGIEVCFKERSSLDDMQLALTVSFDFYHRMLGGKSLSPPVIAPGINNYGMKLKSNKTINESLDGLSDNQIQVTYA